jgi:hypothetical protein
MIPSTGASKYPSPMGRSQPLQSGCNQAITRFEKVWSVIEILLTVVRPSSAISTPALPLSILSAHSVLLGLLLFQLFQFLFHHHFFLLLS